MATIVTILFNTVRPDKAFFGQKDAQQVAVVKRLTLDLGFETEIVVIPTVREESGLAMSSRNETLTPEERDKAAVIFRSLSEAKNAYEKGERNPAELAQMVRDLIEAESLARIDYVSVVDADSLEPVDNIDNTDAIIAVAVFFGKVQLIDNIRLNRVQ